MTTDNLEVHLIKGSDEVLIKRSLDALIDQLLDGDSRDLSVEEHPMASPTASEPEPEASWNSDEDETAPAARPVGLETLLDALGSPPLFTQRRIVVVPDAGSINAAAAKLIVEGAQTAAPGVALVLVLGGGRLAKALADLAGDTETVDEDVNHVLATLAKEKGLHLDARAKQRLVDHVGAHPGRLQEILNVISSAFGSERVTADDLTLYLTDQSAVPAYTLTNAIDKGDTREALTILHRLMHATSPSQPRPMHPLQILAMIHSHVRKLARLDDPHIRNERDAHQALGSKGSPYGAKKAWQTAKSWGTERIQAAYADLLHADQALKGASALPDDAVMISLVARLATRIS
ncbi:MAG: hypothetical protein WBD02_03670 [Acidimicrobiia bacterium]